MKEKKYLRNIFLLLAITCSLFFSVQTAAATRKTDVDAAEGSNVLMAVNGTFYTVSKETILKRINAIRKEACKEGVKNPDTGETLTLEDYVPIKWSSDLEWIAQTRAAEAAVSEGHTRPNGNSCFSAQHNDVVSNAENLAWNWSGIMDGIEQWYEEKNDWVSQTGGVTGHYTSLINPGYKYIALGGFRLSSGGWYCVAAEFSRDNGLDETQTGVSGAYSQMIEVPKASVKVSLSQKIVLTLNRTKQLNLIAKTSQENVWGGTKTVEGTISGKITWTSSKPAVISVNQTGKITAVGNGSAVITAAVNDMIAKTTVTVPYSISYQLKGGTNHKSNPKTYLSSVTLKNPTRKKYIFSGWYTDSAFKKKVKVLTGGNQTVYAKWTKVTVPKSGAPKLVNTAGKKLKISFAAVKKAKGYQVQYALNKKFTKGRKTYNIKTRKKTVTLKKGKTYYVRIRAYRLDSAGSKVYGAWSKVKSGKIRK